MGCVTPSVNRPAIRGVRVGFKTPNVFHYVPEAATIQTLVRQLSIVTDRPGLIEFSVGLFGPSAIRLGLVDTWRRLASRLCLPQSPSAPSELCIFPPVFGGFRAFLG